MKVLKFGGTSVGSPESLTRVKEIVCSQEGTAFVVLSAMSGVTNELLQVLEAIKNGDQSKLEQSIAVIQQKHEHLITTIFTDEVLVKDSMDYVIKTLQSLHDLSKTPDLDNLYSEVITVGELLSTYVFSNFLKQDQTPNSCLRATDFMHIANSDNPAIGPVKSALDKVLAAQENVGIYITQGFVCLDAEGKVSNLKRGGSDYSATIIGAALDADEVQIWTDIDGFHNNDPRCVDNTQPIAQLTYDEAAELAYFGAKILHPKTVSPVREKGIPVFLKNTFDPESVGTKISDASTKKGLKAIAAKDGITAINIKSNQMLMAYGFLRKVFEVFEKFETPIDMITTSEIAVSLTIDDTKNLAQIISAIEKYATVTIAKEQTIISVVGDSLISEGNSIHIFSILDTVPVRMISYGGSTNNISILVDTDHKIQALRLLNTALFEVIEA